MLRSTALLLAVLLTFALPAYADQIHCSDVLTGSGTTYVLDTDLVCAQAALGQAAPASPVTAGPTFASAQKLPAEPGLRVSSAHSTGPRARESGLSSCAA